MTPPLAEPATRRFDYFVLLAEMRTGSNFLEANLNDLPGVICHGEAFNPHFIGHKGQEQLLDVTLAKREAAPLLLLQRMRDQHGVLPGFRYFHDHDPRVLEHCLPDPRCAKIILTRNPLESYVSLKIAAQTGQWKLSDLKHQKTAQVRFEPVEFERHMAKVQAFQVELLRGLQVSGQTAFYLAYEDIGDIDVLNGLARFLGVAGALEAPSKALKKQNPDAIGDKVSNPAEMEAALGRLDRFNLSRTPNFEPRRGASVPGFIAAARKPLLFLPIRSTGEARVLNWLAALDGVTPEMLPSRFTHKSLRQWQRHHAGHQCFAVIRHPVARAHATFCDTVLTNALPEVCKTLRKVYKVALPVDATPLGLAEHRAVFLSYLQVLKGVIAGQSSLRIDASMATQAAVLQGYSQVVQPDLILREDGLAAGLAFLAAAVGSENPALPLAAESALVTLGQIYDAGIEAAVQDAYQRDYVAFGFGPWRA